MTIATTHTQLTVNVSPITSPEFDDIQSDVNEHHGNLLIETVSGPGVAEGIWRVSVHNDKGDTDSVSHVPVKWVEDQLYKVAFQQGWVDFDDNVFGIELAQFDVFDLGYCVQMAAFGKAIVG